MQKCAIVLFAGLLLLTACETNPPQINSLFWQYTYRKDLTLNREISDLSLFLHVVDEDGIDDIETIFLFHDEKNLYWEINSDSWVSKDEKGANWLGVNNLRMPDYSPLPAGEYRILIRDVGGETAEKYTSITPGRISKIYPQVSINEGRLSVRGTAASYILRIYDNSDVFIFQYVYTPGTEVDLEQEIIQRHKLSRGSYLEVYTFDQRQDAGFTIGPYFLSSE